MDQPPSVLSWLPTTRSYCHAAYSYMALVPYSTAIMSIDTGRANDGDGSTATVSKEKIITYNDYCSSMILQMQLRW